LQAGHRGRSAGLPIRPRAGLDLRRFPSTPTVVAAAWRHDIRRLERDARLALPELCDEGRPQPVVGRLRSGRWELAIGASPQQAGGAVACDDRGRVLLPLGVRRTLGIGGAVVVSFSADSSTVAVWPTTALDQLLEVER
jgi:hypothetical protein